MSCPAGGDRGQLRNRRRAHPAQYGRRRRGGRACDRGDDCVFEQTDGIARARRESFDRCADCGIDGLLLYCAHGDNGDPPGADEWNCDRAQPTYDYFKQMQDRILKFVVQHSKAEQNRLEELMMNTGILTKDLGTILVGGQAVEEGLIDSIGGIHEAFAKLHQLIQETKSGGKKSF